VPEQWKLRKFTSNNSYSSSAKPREKNEFRKFGVTHLSDGFPFHPALKKSP